MKKRRGKVWACLAVVLAGALAVLVWAGFGGRHSKSDYYFPVWQRGDDAFGPAIRVERLQRLTNVAVGLPIALDAAERTPTEWELRWNDSIGKLPKWLGRHLPRYGGGHIEPSIWLGLAADDPSVADAVVRRWPEWSGKGPDSSWLKSQRASVITNRTEYIPLLIEACRSTNRADVVWAVRWLAAYRPMTDATDHAIADAIRRCWNGPGLESAMVEAGPGGVDMVTALAEQTKSNVPDRAGLAALLLSKLEPVRFPPDESLKPFWPNLSKDAASRILAIMSLRQSRTLVSTPSATRFLGDVLARLDPAGPPDSRIRITMVFRVMENMGTNAGPLAARLIPWMSSTNATRANDAARCFASIAPASPDLVREIVPRLSDSATATPLLLWLTSIGTNAIAAQAAVESIAGDSIFYARKAHGMDPDLARRYGLLPKGYTGSPTRPSSTAATFDECAERHRSLWPSLEDEITRPIPSDLASRLAALNEFFPDNGIPDSTMAELARRCLRAMTNAGPATAIQPP